MRRDRAEVILAAMVGAKVIVIGDAMVDRYVYGRIDRRSPEADCGVFVPEQRLEMPGGAANVRANVNALGGVCTLVSPPGRSVKTRYVLSATNEQVLRVDEDETQVSPMMADTMLGKYLSSLKHADIVIFSDYAKGALQKSIIEPAMNMARAERKPVIVDPKYPDWSRYAGATVITPNTLEYAVSQRPAKSSYATVVTRGMQGALAIPAGSSEGETVPGFAVPKPDAVGAGDSFVAGFAMAWTGGADLIEAATVGNAAAAVACGKRGTATASRREIAALLGKAST